MWFVGEVWVCPVLAVLFLAGLRADRVVAATVDSAPGDGRTGPREELPTPAVP